MKTSWTLEAILWIGFTTVLAGGINYLYHPLMLQFMSLETFGEFTSILWVFNILGVLTTGISLFLVQKIAQQKDKSQIYALFRWAFPRCLLVWIGVFLFFICCTPFLRSYLHLQDSLPLILVAFSVILGFASTPFSALLQWIQSFRFLWISGVVGALLKLIIGVGLAYLGLGIYAAIWWLLWGGILVFLFVAWIALFKIFSLQDKKIGSDQNFSVSFRSELASLWQMLFLVVLLSFFMNGDIILARNIFDSTTSWIYGALAVVGKFVIFVGAAIETVYYPKIMQYNSPKSLPFAWLKNPLLLLLVCLLVAVGGTHFFGAYVLWLMKKPELLSFAPQLTLIVVMCSLYGFMSLYAKILVAWKDKFVNFILLFIGVSLLIILYSFPWLTLFSYVWCIIIAECVLIWFLLWRVYIHYKSFLDSDSIW